MAYFQLVGIENGIQHPYANLPQFAGTTELFMTRHGKRVVAETVIGGNENGSPILNDETLDITGELY